MAKKSKARAQTLSPRQRSLQKPLTPRRWRLKLVIGGAVLAVVLGVGVVVKYNPGLVRFLQQRDLSPPLQGTVDKHYTRGTAGAAVVIKEFSDYT
jgi:glucose/arabinose dehydrogenase